jgi:hypothetical protein
MESRCNGQGDVDMQQEPLKRLYSSSRLHDTATHKTAIFKVVKTSVIASPV